MSRDMTCCVTWIYINILLDTLLASPVEANSCNHSELPPNMADNKVADEDSYF